LQLSDDDSTSITKFGERKGKAENGHRVAMILLGRGGVVDGVVVATLARRRLGVQRVAVVPTGPSPLQRVRVIISPKKLETHKKAPQMGERALLVVVVVCDRELWGLGLSSWVSFHHNADRGPFRGRYLPTPT
jgi:hypothetical protein